MPAAERLIAPVGYSGWWLVLAVALFAVVMAWIASVFWCTRNRRPRPVDVAAVRMQYLAEIDEIGVAVGQGALTPRATHLRLSAVVRGYVDAVSDAPAAAMTLAELTQSGLGEPADVIAGYYPHEFTADADGDPQCAVQQARRLVSAWG